MIRRLLIANRGEISCRITLTAKRMGIHCIAVYSDTDQHALHTTLADEAWYIGDSSPKKSYLNIDAIIQTALKSQADAIHPGYGFLSENADFATACKQHNLLFIGPSPESIAQMGSKIESKNIMQQAAIPMLPGLALRGLSLHEIKSRLSAFEYPLLLKASAGGGGKGMRIVHTADDFDEAYKRASSEAEKSFGDSALLMEKYLIAPRHIEIQIFFDQQGNGVYLFDRDCSIQRRHQKIVEEAPAPAISPELQKEMGKTALTAARAINYTGAGTIEFLLDKNNHFYFMEMNTRLQVEHPVTELITGIDLVAWQIKIAQGEPLPLKQSKINKQGHSIEVRLYAEDPENSFLPASGKLNLLHFPENNEHCRIDTGVQQGDMITTHYDPLLAKIVSFGKTRNEAINHLLQTLNKIHLIGVTTNLYYLKQTISSTPFQQASIDTHFLQTHAITSTVECDERENAFIIAALIILYIRKQASSSSPWSAASGWRLNQDRQHRISLNYLNSSETETKTLLISESEDDCFSILRTPVPYSARIVSSTESNLITICLNHRQITIPYFYASSSQQLSISLPQVSHSFQENTNDSVGEQSTSFNKKAFDRAPMSGKIIERFCASAQLLKVGQPILVMEAMKMEYTVKAPASGCIQSFHFQKGSFVEEGALLFDFVEQK